MSRSELERLVEELGAFAASCVYFEEEVLHRILTQDVAKV